jgi:hypothetical protein
MPLPLALTDEEKTALIGLLREPINYARYPLPRRGWIR